METLSLLERPQQPLHEYLRDHARSQPDKPAFIWYGTTISYGELDRASDAFAARLQSLGVRRGEPVALYMNNCPQYVMAHFGIQKIGAIVCPCGPLYKQHELAYQVGDLKARVIIAADSLLDVVAKIWSDSSLEHVFVVRYADLLPLQPVIDIPPDLRTPVAPVPEGMRCEDFLEATRSGNRPASHQADLDEVVLMTYTSGTTGLPKGAMLTYRNALYKASAAGDCNQVDRDAVLLAVAPLYHIAGMVMGINVTILEGATTVLLHRFDPQAIVQAIEKYRISWWYSIAPMNVAVMQTPLAQTADLSSLRFNPVTSFGIQFTEKLAREWQEFAPRCQSFEAAYGLSETHTVDTYMPHGAIRWGTHGKPVPGNEIRIIDPASGAGCAVNETGEIVMRSAGVFRGYWGRPEATAATLRDGWVYTGDMGKIDEDGYLTFLGRFKEMIKVSGYSVFPEEVESMLVRHPAIAQAAVIGIPDADKGEAVKAFIVLRPGQDSSSEQIFAWCRENMAKYKVPREISFIEALPATGAGKVLRRLLKDQI